MKLTYYKNLDGIRAIAALMVMAFHFFTSIEINTPVLSVLYRMSSFGRTGVTLFFVLSGFLITRILLSTKNEEHFFKNFYIRRSLRIFPLYYLFLLIYFFVCPLILGTTDNSFREQAFYYSYLQNIALTFNWIQEGPVHFWSLAVEEHFYLFWPLVIYFFSQKNLFRIIVAIILGSLLLRVILLMQGYNVFYFTFTNFDSLAIGALLALMEPRQVFNRLYATRFLWVAIGFFIPTVALWLFMAGDGSIFVQVLKFSLMSFIYFGVIGYVISIEKDHVVNSFLTNGFLSFTGKISYGLYVYHPLAYVLVNAFFATNHWLINMAMGFTLTYVLAAVSYYLYESQFLRLKKYFTNLKTEKNKEDY